jgi:hypothetical protein
VIYPEEFLSRKMEKLDRGDFVGAKADELNDFRRKVRRSVLLLLRASFVWPYFMAKLTASLPLVLRRFQTTS